MASKFMDATLERAIGGVVSRCGLHVRRGGKKAGPTAKFLHCMLSKDYGEEVVFISRDAFFRDKQKLLVVLRPAFSQHLTAALGTVAGVTEHYPVAGQRELYNSNFEQAYQNEHLANGNHNEAFGHGWLVSIEDGLDALAEFFVTISWSKAA